MQSIKHCNADIKDISDSGKFAGYASIFNIEDSVGDVILPGAFHNSFKNVKDIKLLWQHKAEEPIGFFTTIAEDVKGLYVEGQLLLDIPKGLEAYNLLKNDIVNGLSIGFEIKDSTRYEEARYIKRLTLWEISIVTFPSNHKARIDEVKEMSHIYQAIQGGIDTLTI